MNGEPRELLILNFSTSEDIPNPSDVPALLLVSVLIDCWEFLRDYKDSLSEAWDLAFLIDFDDYFSGTWLFFDEPTIECLLSGW
jgi:hypothetical protein